MVIRERSKTNNHTSIINNRMEMAVFYLFYSTTVENSLQIRLFMQNKAKFRKSQMNVTYVITRNYEKKDTWWSGKKQSQTNPNKANFQKAKMNVNFYSTKDYENNSNCPLAENKPKTNPNKPKQTQFQSQKNAALHLFAVGYLSKKLYPVTLLIGNLRLIIHLIATEKLK